MRTKKVAGGTVRDQLQASLGATYSVGPELGGGGMSRVFIANDARLGRQVVVKVLAPDLAAGLSAERFEREIRLAAAMQHPLIVPLLAAGATGGGLPYYTMPFVEGESLRERMVRETAIPLTDVARILRDVGDALAYAHEKGIVHRDIKPENILLSGGHAVITDFGIARALAAAGSAGVEVTLTATGMAVGTPAYMAPEQVAGDGQTDHRADLYAVGCLAYELLAGRPVFNAVTPQEVFAAHLVQKPKPITELRADTPPRLAEFVMRCLEKRPGDRPQSAAELGRVLDETLISQPITIPQRRPRRAAMFAAIAAAIVVAALVALRALGLWPAGALIAAGVLPEKAALVVADFDVGGADSALSSVLGDAVRADLTQSRVISVMPLSSVNAGLQRMRRPATGRLGSALARELAEREGASAVVEGTLARLDASSYVVTLRLVSAGNGDELASYRETAEGAQGLLPAVGKLTRKLRGKIGESLSELRASPPLPLATTSSLEAFRKYTAGLRANASGQFLEATSLYEQAVAIDSTFASAWMRLALSIANTVSLWRPGMRSQRLVDALTIAYRLRDRLPEAERLAVEAEYFTWVRPNIERVLADYRELLAIDSTSPATLNNFAMKYRYRTEHEQTIPLFRRAAALAPDIQLYTANLTTGLINLGRYHEADSLFQILDRRFPHSTMVSRLRLWFVLTRGPMDSLPVAVAGLPGAAEHAAGERLRGRLADADQLEAMSHAQLIAAGWAPAPLFDGLPAIESRLWLVGDTAGAVRRLDSLLARNPLRVPPARERPYFAIATDYARAGLPDRGRAIVAEYERDVTDSLVRRERGWERLNALGEISLAEGKWQDAIGQFQTARRLSVDYVDQCPSCVYERVGRAYDMGGMRDSALANYQRYLTAPYAIRVAGDSWYRARVERRLGDLYADAGDRVRAAAHYRTFLTMWRDADPELQSQVSAVRRKLEILGGSAER